MYAVAPLHISFLHKSRKIIVLKIVLFKTTFKPWLWWIFIISSNILSSLNKLKALNTIHYCLLYMQNIKTCVYFCQEFTISSIKFWDSILGSHYFKVPYAGSICTCIFPIPFESGRQVPYNGTKSYPIWALSNCSHIDKVPYFA